MINILLRVFQQWFSLFSVNRWLDWLTGHHTAFYQETHCIWLSDWSIVNIHQYFPTMLSIFISLLNFYPSILKCIMLLSRHIISLDIKKHAFLVLSFLFHVLAWFLHKDLNQQFVDWESPLKTGRRDAWLFLAVSSQIRSCASVNS